MPEQMIEEALPGRAPSAEFVLRLRSELADAWQHDKPVVRTPQEPNRRHALVWVAALAAAAALVVAVVSAPDPGRRIQPATTPATTADSATTSTIAESSTAPTTTALTGTRLLEVLSGHRWIAQPSSGAPFVPAAQWIEFNQTGQVLTVFDGCGAADYPMDLVDRTVSVPSGITPSECGNQEPIDSINGASMEITTGEGVLYLTLVPTDPANLASTYMALDSFETATADETVGDWKLVNSATIHFAEQGTVDIGFCNGVGNWTLTDGQFSVYGVDVVENNACAAGSELRWLSQVENSTWTARSSGYLLLSNGDNTLVLSPSSFDRTTDVLDLIAGTIYGFGLPTTAPADFVAGVVSGEQGEPTFDSGWYTVSTDASCLGGQPARLIQWGDLVLAFTRVGDQDQLWSWSLGDSALAAAQRFGIGGGLPSSSATNLQSRPPNRIGIGTTLEEIRSWHAAAYEGAFAFAEISLTDVSGQPTSIDDEAVTGVLVIGQTAVDLVLDHGTIVWMSVMDSGSC